MQATKSQSNAARETVQKTLNDYAKELAAATGGKIVFLSPNYGVIVRKDGCEVELPGPTQADWRYRCANRVADACATGN